MAHKLSGKRVDETVLEIGGPVTGVNYNTSNVAAPPAAEMILTVSGTGTVRLESNTTPELVGNAGPNVFTRGLRPTDAGWTSIGTASAGAPVTVALTPDANFQVLRIVVDVAGDGDVAAQSSWR